MQRLFLLVVLAVVTSLPTPVHADETYDIASYAAPRGWKKEARAGSVVYSKTPRGGSYCALTIYRSAAGLGDVTRDFEHDWQTLVQAPLKVKDKPTTQAGERNNGWDNLAGGANFEYAGGTSVVLLSTYAAGGRVFSLLIVSNDPALIGELDPFLKSLKLAAPPAAAATSSPAAPSDTTKTTTTGGARTTFDDGWSATIASDRVVVTKADVEVWLYHVRAYDDASRQAGGHVYWWNNVVAKAFDLKTTRIAGAPSDPVKPPYIEGEAIDRSSGERRFLALYVSSSSGLMIPTLAIARTEAALRQTFPKAADAYASDLADMRRYNKFQVAAADLPGTWLSGGTSAMEYYNAYTGAYQGLGVAASADTFVFKSDGTYTSEHKGATGKIGSLNTFQQKYKGRFKVGTWELTMDHRFEGKTDQFNAYFEAVAGGRVLHLQNKKYTSSWSHLVRKQ